MSEGSPGDRLLCQVCGATNDPESDFCRRCQQKLMVVSGAWGTEELEVFDGPSEDAFSLDEHLLERISLLEEVVRRTGEGLRRALATLYRLEQKILMNHTGVHVLRDLLDAKHVLPREEWGELWESRMRSQLLALEKREGLKRVKERIAALYQGSDGDAFRRLLNEADQALLGFDIETAMRSLEEAHDLDSGNHELSFFLAETFFNEGRNEAAAQYFDRVLEAAPEHFESLVYSGVLCHVRGQEELAEKRLERAVELYPEAFLPAFSLGAMYAGRGRLEQAMELLERAVGAEEVPQAHLLLGRCAYDLGRLGSAIRHLETCLDLDPSSEEAHGLLGLACLERGWHKKAQRIFRRGQRRAPFRLAFGELVTLFPGVVEGAGEVLESVREALAEGLPQEALSLLRRALADSGEDPAVLLVYGMVCLDVGRGEEVEATVAKVLTLDPPEDLATAAHFLRLEDLRARGQRRPAERGARILQADATSDLAQAAAACQLALALAAGRSDLEEALGVAQQGFELAPSSLQPLLRSVLGWVLLRRGEPEEALEHLEQAVADAPWARVWVHLGMARLAADQKEAAREAFLQARELLRERSDPAREILATFQDGARLHEDPLDVR